MPASTLPLTERALLPSERRQRRPVQTLVLLLLLNLIPLLGLNGIVQESALGTVSGYSLMPILVVPTAIITAGWDRRWYLIQLLIAAVVCFAVIGAGPHTASARLVGAISTVGTLVFVMLLVANGKRRVEIDLQRMQKVSVTDALTGALNRRGFEQAVPGLVDRAQTEGQPVGIAAVDLDHFKRINDVVGHDAGDRVLQEVAEVAQDTVGGRGVVVRSGGEEFLIILVGDIGDAITRVRHQLARTAGHPGVTVSVGMVTADAAEIRDVDGMWAAVDYADRWLYQAKAEGRDRTVDGGRWRREELPDEAASDSSSWAVGSAGVMIPSADEAQTAAESADQPPAAPAAPAVGTAIIGSGTDRNRHRTVSRSHSRARRRRRIPAPLHVLASRSRDQRIDRRTRTLYQAIIVWMVVVGVIATVQQAMSEGSGLAATAGMMAAGVVIAVVAILWLRRVRTAWQFMPLALFSAPFEMAAVFTLPPEARPAALMLVLLAAFLVVTHWPGIFIAIEGAIVIAGALGAASFAPRPVAWQLAVAVVTAVPLIIATVVVGRIRSHQQDVEDELRTLALVDPLTGLGNRRALDAAAARWQSGELVMLDIDHFKGLNDRYGHAVGDMVLVSLAETLTRLASHPHGSGVAYRIGGDEFVIAGPRLDARAMLGLLSGSLPGLPVTVTVSGGSGSWPSGDGDGLWDALAVADQRMLHRKRVR